jgi:hypothetical protein
MLFWKAAAHSTPPFAGTLDARFPERFPLEPDVYAAFRHNDAELKAWLPAAIWLALEEIADTTDCHRAEWIRRALFRHVYGDLDLARMREAREGFWWRPPVVHAVVREEADHPMFSRRRGETPELGKSTAELRLELPARLLADLQALAGARGAPLSSFVRQLLIKQVLGRHYLQDGA